VLPIALGEATKLAGRMLDSDKIYEFTITFGSETDSLDLEGAVIATSGVRPSIEDVEAILPSFNGPIEQVPPAYSALKVDGKRAYDLARAGEAVVLESRAVIIHSLRVVASSREQNGLTRRREDAKEWLDHLTLIAHVSKGTYIRSLARDIAYALGTVGHVTMLRRTKAGPFTLANSISLDILFEKSKAHALEDIILPIRTALDDIPALALSPEQARLLYHGQVLTGIVATEGLMLALDGEKPLALVEILGGNARSVRRFNL
jgi:tRNA pseudouridine55 synthase